MKVLEFHFQHRKLLSSQLDAAIKAQREMRLNLVKEGRVYVERIRRGFVNEKDCDRLDEILEDLL